MPAILLVVPFLLLLSAAGLALLLDQLPASWAKLRSPVLQGWLLSVFPALAVLLFIPLTRQVVLEKPLLLSQPWLPSLGLNFVLYLDGLSAMFGLLITGIGALVLVYTGYYFSGKPGVGRFFCYLILFMTSMLGLVLAGDLILVFIFWEGTSLLSYLLIAYNFNQPLARQGAFRSLFITGSGGIALLIGFLLLGQVSGTFSIEQIIQNNGLVLGSDLYPWILILIALGAFTKSAQVPFHIWLPGAMSAPTPASAFLHSATMVKAGIYILARLHPAIGRTDLWFWLLTITGLSTMIIAAVLGLRQYDLKRLLAYSTISQLGVMVALLGQDTSIAFKALVVSILAHALYKSALFLLTGIIDHETGTRDIRKLGGLWKKMPRTALFSGLAALSMAGLPPLFGFLAKETLLATAVHPGLPPLIDILFPSLTVFAGALLLVLSGIFFFDTFLGKKGEASQAAHDPPLWMLFAPAIPAVLSLSVGLAPEPLPLAELLAKAAQAAYGEQVKVSLALWTGINVPLVLSIIAISLGTGMFLIHRRLRAALENIPESWNLERVYQGILGGIDRLSGWAVRLQSGALRRYLAIMLVAVGCLLVGLRALPLLPGIITQIRYPFDLFFYLQTFAIVVAALTALVGVFVRRDLLAIFLMATSGLAVALSMALEPAPDVSLVQIVVDILVTVILVLSLSRLPRVQRMRAAEFTFKQSRLGLARDGMIAAGSGLVIFLIALAALSSRPRESLPAEYYLANAKPLTEARDAVGAVVVDFRGFDTLIEITVFAMAGIGVYTLLNYASRKAKDPIPHETFEEPSPEHEAGHPKTRGIGSLPTSPMMHLLAYLMLPLVLVMAIVYLMYGHNQPGDGFTAGVIIALGIAFWDVVFGFSTTHRRLKWIRPMPLVIAGLGLELINGSLAALLSGNFMANVDYGKLLTSLLGMPMPGVEFHLNSAFIFELAICLAVLGGSNFILDTLGRPRTYERESTTRLKEIPDLDESQQGVISTHGTD